VPMGGVDGGDRGSQRVSLDDVDGPGRRRPPVLIAGPTLEVAR
jgi:hypothetical protein